MGSWLVSPNPHAAERPTLLCLPHAGAGAGRYRPWQNALGDAVSVVGVQLPGRENRWNEPHPSTMDEAVAAVLAELVALVPADQPLVVFGESFGGLLGYELTRRLGTEHGRQPAALVIAACEPPHLWSKTADQRDDDDALRRLLDGTGALAELDEDSREFVVDILRRDANLVSTFTIADERTVGAPLHAWGGNTDTLVTPAELDEWKRYTTSEFVREQFDGGHMFGTELSPRTVPMLAGLLGVRL